jgi:hypothetical protein
MFIANSVLGMVLRNLLVLSYMLICHGYNYKAKNEMINWLKKRIIDD